MVYNNMEAEVPSLIKFLDSVYFILAFKYQVMMPWTSRVAMHSCNSCHF